MTTGTEGNDNLSNNPAVRPETVDGLGGDDVITIVRPNLMIGMDSTTIAVKGDSGTDVLINDAEARLASAGTSGLGGNAAYEGHVFLRLVRAAAMRWTGRRSNAWS